MTRKDAKDGAEVLQQIADGLANVKEGIDPWQWLGLAIVVIGGTLLDIAVSLNPKTTVKIEEDAGENAKI